MEAAFSPDGRRILGMPGATIWSAQTGEILGAISSGGTPVLSPDGDRLLLYGQGRPTILYPASRSSLLDLAESRLPVTLVAESRAQVLERL